MKQIDLVADLLHVRVSDQERPAFLKAVSQVADLVECLRTTYDGGTGGYTCVCYEPDSCASCNIARLIGRVPAKPGEWRCKTHPDTWGVYGDCPKCKAAGMG